MFTGLSKRLFSNLSALRRTNRIPLSLEARAEREVLAVDDRAATA